jgi:metal-responsive CopG/Arc/MetJ family transcriptional regulator
MKNKDRRVKVTISIPPGALKIFDYIAEREQMSRSQIIWRLAHEQSFKWIEKNPANEG